MLDFCPCRIHIEFLCFRRCLHIYTMQCWFLCILNTVFSIFLLREGTGLQFGYLTFYLFLTPANNWDKAENKDIEKVFQKICVIRSFSVDFISNFAFFRSSIFNNFVLFCMRESIFQVSNITSRYKFYSCMV